MVTKTFSLLLFLFCTFFCFSQKKKISLTITQLEPYCGGARPTKEMQQQTQIPKPYVNKTMIVVSESGKVDSSKTNALGVLKLKLKPGKYKLLEGWHYYKRIPTGFSEKDFDMNCLKQEWQKELYSIIVDSKKAEAIPERGIIIYCPWATPCLLESARPALPQ